MKVLPGAVGTRAVRARSWCARGLASGAHLHGLHIHLQARLDVRIRPGQPRLAALEGVGDGANLLLLAPARRHGKADGSDGAAASHGRAPAPTPRSRTTGRLSPDSPKLTPRQSYRQLGGPRATVGASALGVAGRQSGRQLGLSRATVGLSGPLRKEARVARGQSKSHIWAPKFGMRPGATLSSPPGRAPPPQSMNCPPGPLN